MYVLCAIFLELTSFEAEKNSHFDRDPYCLLYRGDADNLLLCFTSVREQICPDLSFRTLLRVHIRTRLM